MHWPAGNWTGILSFGTSLVGFIGAFFQLHRLRVQQTEIHVIVNNRTDALMLKVTALEKTVSDQAVALRVPPKLAYTKEEWQAMTSVPPPPQKGTP